MFLAMPCLSWLATFKRKKRKKKERERKKNIGKKRQEKKERKEERREGNYKFTFFPSYFLHPFLVLEVSLFSPHLLNGGPVLPLQHFCKSKRKRKKKSLAIRLVKKTVITLNKRTVIAGILYVTTKSIPALQRTASSLPGTALLSWLPLSSVSCLPFIVFGPIFSFYKTKTVIQNSSWSVIH